MQFSMQEVENQMRREKQSKAKAEDVDTVKPDISNLEPCSTSRSANAMSLANDSRRNGACVKPMCLDLLLFSKKSHWLLSDASSDHCDFVV